MPDITMCFGAERDEHGKLTEKVCPKAESCYRAQARPTPGRQSYFMRLPIVNGVCEHYWAMEEKT